MRGVRGDLDGDEPKHELACVGGRDRRGQPTDRPDHREIDREEAGGPGQAAGPRCTPFDRSADASADRQPAKPAEPDRDERANSRPR